MKIDAIAIENFQGARNVNVRTPEQVVLFAGDNAAGKSSIRDAIKMLLSGELGRVARQKDAGELVTGGANAAFVQVTVDGKQHTLTITDKGKITDSLKGQSFGATMPYVLDGQRLAKMPVDERRAYLYGLAGVQIEANEIQRRLFTKLYGAAPVPEVDRKRVEHIATLLRGGFEAAAKEASGKATEAKGAWKATTGEAWGSEKGKVWRAAVKPYDATAAQAVETQLEHCEHALEQWNQTIGSLQAEEQRRQRLAAQLPALRQRAGLVQRATDKLAADKASLTDFTAELERLRKAAGTAPRVGLVHELARVLSDLMMALPTPADSEPHAKVWDECLGATEQYVAQHGPVIQDAAGDPEARAKLPQAENSVRLMTSAVSNAERDLTSAQQAADEMDAITAELAEEWDADGLANARAQVDELKAERARVLASAEEFRSIKVMVEGAEAKTKAAAKQHADVMGWANIAAALGPDGIPADMLAEALGPMNARLEQSAADSQWAQVVIHGDMRITSDGRSYHLLSESEQWRADAMLAEAVSHISGLKLLVLDRVDVLLPHHRKALLEWLDILAGQGEVDTALLFMATKTMPTGLPPTMAAFWIEAGTAGELAAAA